MKSLCFNHHNTRFCGGKVVKNVFKCKKCGKKINLK